MTWRGDFHPSDDLDELVAGYFRDAKILAAETARHLAEHSPIERTPIPGYDGRLFDWLTEMLHYGPTDGPEQAWPIILTLVDRAPDERALIFIGCGALEDLVNGAGLRFQDRIVSQANRDARFRRALASVWPDDGAPAVLKSMIESSRPLQGPGT